MGTEVGKKIKIAFFSNQLSLGGTEKAMALFCKHLSKDDFEAYVITCQHHMHWAKRLHLQIAGFFNVASATQKLKTFEGLYARAAQFEKMLGVDRVLYARNDEHLRDLVAAVSPDILHVFYSGRAEPPTSDEVIMSSVPVTITTNAFEFENTSLAHRHVKKILLMSEWVQKNAAPWALGDKRVDFLYLPIEAPASRQNLRAALNIPENAFVLGRVGRPDDGIHDGISLRAFARIQNENTYFLALAAPEKMKKEAKALRLKNFIALPAITQEAAMSEFYNTIDVLAHARVDGETFGLNIAEAMIHSKPVVSHKSRFMNAQVEVIADTGFVVEIDDDKTYAEHLCKLRENAGFARELGKKASARAFEEFEVSKLTSKLAQIYKNAIGGLK